jgi:hypothetical protein
MRFSTELLRVRYSSDHYGGRYSRYAKSTMDRQLPHWHSMQSRRLSENYFREKRHDRSEQLEAGRREDKVRKVQWQRQQAARIEAGTKGNGVCGGTGISDYDYMTCRVFACLVYPVAGHYRPVTVKQPPTNGFKFEARTHHISVSGRSSVLRHRPIVRSCRGSLRNPIIR